MKICPICASENISNISELFDQSIDAGAVNLDWCRNCGTLVHDNYSPTQVIYPTVLSTYAIRESRITGMVMHQLTDELFVKGFGEADGFWHPVTLPLPT